MTCDECKGTGVYVGLHIIEPCSRGCGATRRERHGNPEGWTPVRDKYCPVGFQVLREDATGQLRMVRLRLELHALEHDRLEKEIASLVAHLHGVHHSSHRYDANRSLLVVECQGMPLRRVDGIGVREVWESYGGDQPCEILVPLEWLGDHVEHIVRAYPPTGEGASIGLDYVCPRTGEREQWRRWEPFRVEVRRP